MELTSKPYYVDYHIHSHFSSDAESTMAEHCQRAISLGLAEIGFNEHADFDPEDEGTGFLNWDDYSAAINQSREHFRGRLTVRKGLEMCFQPCLADEIFGYFGDKEEDVDYLMGSVHWIDHKRVGKDFFASLSEEEAYGIYFDQVAQLAQTGHFDILGHLDLVKRHGTRYYGPFRFDRYRSQIGGVLELVVQKGMALEVNASGLRQAPGEPYPGLATLQLYRRLGGELVTIGSDAHSADLLGSGVLSSLDLLKQAGFRWLTLFDRRKPFQVPFE